MSSQPEWVEAQLAQRHCPPGISALSMRWQNLLFLHWQWEAAAIQRTLPPGLVVDTFEGRAWLAVVPFFMRKVHPRGLPCVPGLSDFLELNVRTYVRNEEGVPGVWFYSLSCNQPLAVMLARGLFHLNYVNARIAARTDRLVTYYESYRPGGPLAKFRYSTVAAMEETKPGSLEFFLAERYVLYSTSGQGRLFAGKVHHSPYLVASAEAPVWSFQPAISDGFSSPNRPPDHVMVAGDLQVEAWPLRRADGRPASPNLA